MFRGFLVAAAVGAVALVAVAATGGIDDIRSQLSDRQYLRAIGIALDREGNIQSELAALHPPVNYARPYSLFLHTRRDALAALERLQRATREKNREDYVDAARVLAQKKRFIDHYAEAAGMPACAFSAAWASLARAPGDRGG